MRRTSAAPAAAPAAALLPAAALAAALLPAAALAAALLPAAALAAALLPAAAAAAEPAAACNPDAADIRTDTTRLRFSVELADTPETRARGLMFREALPRFGGMLFVYEAPQAASFWMENTPLPLDMLFFDEAGVLRHVHADAVPFSREVIDGGSDILFVLEINGGLAAALGLAPGAELRHPAVDPALAAWPCPD